MSTPQVQRHRDDLSRISTTFMRCCPHYGCFTKPQVSFHKSPTIKSIRQNRNSCRADWPITLSHLSRGKENSLRSTWLDFFSFPGFAPLRNCSKDEVNEGQKHLYRGSLGIGVLGKSLNRRLRHLSPCFCAGSRASMAPGFHKREIVQQIERAGFGVFLTHLPNDGLRIQKGAE